MSPASLISVPPVQLPAELIDVVIDLVHDDRETLATCALVHKSWIPAARHHLFNKVKLEMSSIEESITYLQSPNSTIGHYIQHIVLSRCSPDNDPGKALAHITAFAPVKKITLRWVDWEGVAIRDLVSSTFRDITELELDYTDFGLFSHIANFISSFPSLEKIRMYQLSLTEDELDDKSKDAGVPSGLRDVELDMCDMVALLSWFASYGKSLVNTLRLINTGSQELEPTGDYLRVLGDALREFHISFQRGDDTRNAYLSRCINLANNTSLRSVRFDDIRLDSSDNRVYHYLPTLISQITSANLEIIIIEFDAEDFDDFTRFDWGHLEKTFDKPPFSDLRTLELRISSLGESNAIEDFIRSQLSHCSYRGVIRFIFL